MNTKLIITVPDVQVPTPHSVYVINPVHGHFEPLATHMLYVLDVYECKPNTRGDYLPKKFKLMKRKKFANFQQAHERVKDLMTKQGKEKKKNRFIMWAQSELGADLCFKEFVKKNIPVKEFLYFDPNVFNTLKEINEKNKESEKEKKEKAQELINNPTPIKSQADLQAVGNA